MTWVYRQKTGNLFYDGEVEGSGYSGHLQGKNNPDMQNEPSVGPIPVGMYTIGAPRDSLTHGPFVLPLTPFPTNQMFGRSGFLMHGDSLMRPGDASLGCIIMPRSVREKVLASNDYTLRVESGVLPVLDLDGELSV